MGYTTEFEGVFKLDKPLTVAHLNYLIAFNESRRVKRDAIITVRREDPKREAVGLPVGVEGGYFVNEDGFAGQGNGEDVLDHNNPPAGQPGLWCKWIPNEDGTGIEWDGNEKFYDYIKWIEYLIEHFLKPWGYVVNGNVEWNGEGRKDFGTIRIIDNEITILDE